MDYPQPEETRRGGWMMVNQRALVDGLHQTLPLQTLPGEAGFYHTCFMNLRRYRTLAMNPWPFFTFINYSSLPTGRPRSGFPIPRTSWKPKNLRRYSYRLFRAGWDWMEGRTSEPALFDGPSYYKEMLALWILGGTARFIDAECLNEFKGGWKCCIYLILKSVYLYAPVCLFHPWNELAATCMSDQFTIWTRTAWAMYAGSGSFTLLPIERWSA